MNERYYSLNQYLKETFREKVYRLSLDAGMTCPNRDGSLSSGGCIFCSEGGSGDFAAHGTCSLDSINSQLEEAKARIQKKTNCKKFVAYFQSFTNTYAPLEQLESLYSSVLEKEEIVALSIGTRSDCLPEDVLLLISHLRESYSKPIWVELGFQTMHNDTLKRLNTQTTLEQFDSAVSRLNAYQIPVVAHIILGLPGETKDMMKLSVSHIAKTSVWGVKLQLLHVLNGTKLAQQYQSQPFALFELEEYCDFVIDCLELLSPNQVIHRLTGDGPRRLLIAPLWSTDKKRVLNTLQKKLKERDTYQGRLFSPKDEQQA